MTKAVIFDFYGVFQADTYSIWLARNGLTRVEVYETLIKKVDRGEINRTEFTSQLSTTLGRSVTYDEIYGHPQNIDQSVVKLVTELKDRGYRIGLLSNASFELRAKLEKEKLDLLFDSITISSEVGIAKPDIKIFEISLTNLNTTPEKTVFVDDNPLYTAAAATIGISSVQFTSTRALRHSFAELGLII